MEENCIFCKIIRGDFNTEFVLENDYAVVFNDINPAAPIHMLVVPKLHVESLNELDNEELLGKLMMTVKEVTKKIGLNSYKTLINTGLPLSIDTFVFIKHVNNKNVKTKHEIIAEIIENIFFILFLFILLSYYLLFFFLLFF